MTLAIRTIIAMGATLALASAAIPATADEHDHHHAEGVELQLKYTPIH